MLPPHELKTRKFSTVFRGYSPEEVNDQIAFLIEQYTELYRENDELERKLRMALAQLDSYQSDEESIRSALVNAQKAGARILRDASDRADTLMQSTKATCETMVSESAVAIRKQYAVLTTLREQTRILREALISQYTAQFEMIQATVRDEQEAGCEIVADEELVHSIISGIKDEAVRRSERAAADPAPFASDAEVGAEKAPEMARKPRSGTIWNKETVRNAAPTPEKTGRSGEESAQPEAARNAEEAQELAAELPALLPEMAASAGTTEPAEPAAEAPASEANMPVQAETEAPEDPGVPGDTAEPIVEETGTEEGPAEDDLGAQS